MKRRWIFGFSFAALTAFHLCGQTASISVSWKPEKKQEAIAQVAEPKIILKKREIIASAAAAVRATPSNPLLSLTQSDYKTCGRLKLLEVLETMHFKIIVCDQGDSRTQYMYKVDKLSGQRSPLKITKIMAQDQGQVYYAEENGMSYMLDQSWASNSQYNQSSTLGHFIVEERGFILVNEMILSKIVVNTPPS